ncbi:GNAT family N-acetyltransferase [Clostridium nigeriense]|uniref:GNAT family N-acetyltransferase n=1 Tax=Clostridium nigeriense TaxID=1805470 RepID=UPI000835CC26|nr:GNAT family protein [Clostridium nigeriense]
MINLTNKPTIIGNKVILSPFRYEDIEFMEECLKDPEVLKFTGSTADFNRDEIIKWYNSRNEQSDRLDLAIVDKLNDVVVGEVVINEYDEVNHSMNYRILIGPRGRDSGFGSEATSLLVDYVFTNTDLNQLTLGVYAFNPRGKRIYEKCGFVLESIDEGDLEFQGQMIDLINMILKREDWEKIKKLDKE